VIALQSKREDCYIYGGSFANHAARPMSTDKRRSRRRPLQHEGRIKRSDGEPQIPCSVRDISATGARLAVEMPAAVPNQFILLLSRDGRTRRACAVVWRSAEEVGVEFRSQPGAQPKPNPAAKRPG
jgi:PilZ domain-containing protein